MPLLFEQQLSEGTHLCLWHITETEGRLSTQCTDDEIRTATFFASAHRRREYLAWRGIVHRLAPHATINYDKAGGPLFTNSSKHLGVSHTRDYVAVIVAEHPCAVDIERCDRNFSTALSRYQTEEEKQLSNTLPSLKEAWGTELAQQHFPALLWCAKEAAYKWARDEKIDFLKDIRLHAIDPASHSLQIKIRDRALRLNYQLYGELCCVYGIQ